MSVQKFNSSTILVLLISVICNATGQLFIKYARLVHPNSSLLSLFFHFEIWIGLILYGISAISWLWTLSRTPLSFAYPVLALSFPIVVGLSGVFFSEGISTMHWVGVGIIVVGVAFLART